jgi:hypothetical protein
MLYVREIHNSFWGKKGGYAHFSAIKTFETRMLKEFDSTYE